MKKIIIIVFFPVVVIAQRQERQILVYNLALGGITAGIGAIINKPPKSNWRKEFLDGLWQGSLGGLINYTAKKSAYLINKHQNTFYAIPANLLHAAGYSIIENAAMNRPFLENWNLSYGPVRFDVSLNNKPKLRARFLPASLFAIAYTKQIGKFDVATSLMTGQFAFKNSNQYIYIDDKIYLGYSVGRSIAYVDHISNNPYSTIAHELLHCFQYREYLIFNSWLQPIDKINNKKILKNLFKKYIYFDLPYNSLFYEIEGRFDNPYSYRNFFEFEAERFSTNQYVPVL